MAAVILNNVQPLMRPGAMANALAVRGRSQKLYSRVYIDTEIQEEFRSRADVICIVAELCAPEERLGRGSREAYIVVEACAANPPAALQGTLPEALVRMKANMRARLPRIPEAIRHSVRPLPPNAAAGVDPAWWADINAEIPTDAMRQLIMRSADEDVRPETLRIMVSGLLAFCKQGNATTNVTNKVTMAMREELNVVVSLDMTLIRDVWNIVSPWFTPAVARAFFGMWETTIGSASMRLRLLVQQAGWSGMTNFLNVRNALQRHPTFDWGKLCALAPQEPEAYARAAAVVGNDKYFGYSADLGEAKSTNYKAFSYASFCLLNHVDGERTLQGYFGVHKNIPEAAAIDKMIRDYTLERTARLETLAPDAVSASLLLRVGASINETGAYALRPAADVVPPPEDPPAAGPGAQGPPAPAPNGADNAGNELD